MCKHMTDTVKINAILTDEVATKFLRIKKQKGLKQKTAVVALLVSEYPLS